MRYVIATLHHKCLHGLGGRGKFGKEGEQRGEGVVWPEGKEGSKKEKGWCGLRGRRGAKRRRRGVA